MNRGWVDANLGSLAASLSRELPLNQTREFEPMRKLYDKLFRSNEFNFFARQLCLHIGLEAIPSVEIVGDSDIPILDLQGGLRFFNKVIDSGGDYGSGLAFAPKIRIGASQFRQAHICAHILAHELAHHYLCLKQVRTPVKEESEMFTDLAAVYLGLGKLMLNGAIDEPAEFVKKPIRLSKSGIAYLGYPLLAYSYYLCQEARGTIKHRVYKNLKEPCAGMVRAFAYHQSKRSLWARLLGIFSPRPSLPDTDGTLILKGRWRLDDQHGRVVNCVGCGTKVRIPKRDSGLKVRCPKCNSEFWVQVRQK